MLEAMLALAIDLFGVRRTRRDPLVPGVRPRRLKF